MSSASSPLSASVATPNSPASPLAQVIYQLSVALANALPYLAPAFSFALGLAKSSWAFSQKFMIYPIPIVLYIVAPVTVFVHYLLSIFVFTPYATIAYLLEALHPLYVFCGVACLTGSLFGVIGRLIAWGLVSAIEVDPEPELKGERRRGMVKDELSDA